MVSNNEILSHIIDIKTDVSAIQEHLKTLNGKVASNVAKIEDNRKKVDKLDKTIAVYAAVFTVVVAAVQIAIKLFL